MTATIHTSAIVEAGAQLGEDVVVGPFCHIGAKARIGGGAVLHSHVVVAGRATIGARAQIFPFVSIGAPSQDLKAALAEGAVEIGADCVIREGVTINAGDATRIGDRCAFLAYSHVAHDCRLGDGVVLANHALLGGHVEIDDYAAIGGGTAVHQHVRIGAHAFVGGLAGVEGDVIPFGLAGGNRARLAGLNLVGLQRRGFSAARIAVLKSAYRSLFIAADAGVFDERLARLAAAHAGDADIALLVDFLRRPSPRPLCAPRRRGDSA
jgi:UDP-N-acetylglucosamine acyltransferase